MSDRQSKINEEPRGSATREWSEEDTVFASFRFTFDLPLCFYWLTHSRLAGCSLLRRERTRGREARRGEEERRGEGRALFGCPLFCTVENSRSETSKGK